MNASMLLREMYHSAGIIVPLQFFFFLQICFGHSVCIQKATFDHLMARPKDTTLARKGRIRIFLTAGLVGRSVKGIVSKCTRGPKPPLNQETPRPFLIHTSTPAMFMQCCELPFFRMDVQCGEASYTESMKSYFFLAMLGTWC